MKIHKYICKLFGHNYCPIKISMTGTSIVTITFKCKYCGRKYVKLYPSNWKWSDNGWTKDTST